MIPPPPLYLVDLVAVERVTLDHNSTRVELEIQRSLLFTERIRELAQIAEVQRMILSRRPTSRGLVNILNEGIVKRGGDYWILPPSSDEEELTGAVDEENVVTSEVEEPPGSPMVGSEKGRSDVDLDMDVGMETSGDVDRVGESLGSVGEMEIEGDDGGNDGGEGA